MHAVRARAIPLCVTRSASEKKTPSRSTKQVDQLPHHTGLSRAAHAHVHRNPSAVTACVLPPIGR